MAINWIPKTHPCMVKDHILDCDDFTQTLYQILGSELQQYSGNMHRNTKTLPSGPMQFSNDATSICKNLQCQTSSCRFKVFTCCFRSSFSTIWYFKILHDQSHIFLARDPNTYTHPYKIDKIHFNDRPMRQPCFTTIKQVVPGSESVVSGTDQFGR